MVTLSKIEQDLAESSRVVPEVLGMTVNICRVQLGILIYLSQYFLTDCQPLLSDTMSKASKVTKLATEASSTGSTSHPTEETQTMQQASESRAAHEDDDDDDDYIPFQWVVELRERKSFHPVVSYTVTDDEEGRDRYRNKGFTQLLFRKIERIEEIHHNEEEWLKERKKHRDIKFFNEKGERTDIHGRPIRYHSHGYKDSGSRNPVREPKKPYRSPLRRYRKPPGYPPTKNFKVDNNFKDWVMKGIDFPPPPKEKPFKF